MGERLGLRLRFALFFMALAGGAVVLIAGGLWLGQSRSGGPVDGYVVAGLVSGFGVIGLSAWIGLLFDENVARPILALSAELRTRARSEVASDIDAHPARYLGALAPAAQDMHAALEETRASLETALAEKMALMARDKALLEALLRELSDAILLTSSDGRILLYNRAAAELLGSLGLNRQLARFLRIEPVFDAVARLEGDDDGEPATFLTSSSEGGRILSGTVANVTLDAGRIGHVLLFRDTTEDLRTHGDLEQLLRDTIEGARRPASAMGAVLDALEAVPDMTAEARTRFDAALREELARLSGVLNDVAGREAVLSASHWPIRDIALQQVFDALAFRAGAAIEVTPTDAHVRSDGFAITEILARMADSLVESAGRTDLSIRAEEGGGEVRLVLAWRGPALPLGELETWLAAPIAPAYGRFTCKDALKAHRSDAWVEPGADGGRIVLPLAVVGAPGRARGPGPLDFYDFDLPAASDPELEGRPLSELSFVVFDTETTGLDPARDDVVQIAAIRILAGRLLRGETFDHLVNPGRRIPPHSTEIHGISDAMVAQAPRFADVATNFDSFAEGAVLVAHNAAFDLAFLARLKAQGGPAIEHPALCTARLSLRLFSHSGDHTLDGLAERFGIEIPEAQRHTALGDAVATAEILQKMLPLLEAQGIRTLRDALDWQNPT